MVKLFECEVFNTSYNKIEYLTVMQKQFKIMILVNALLGFLFVACNLAYAFSGKDVYWSPLWLTSYTPGIFDLGTVLPNFSFYLFWVLLAVNGFFLYRVRKKIKIPDIQSKFKTMLFIHVLLGFLFVVFNLTYFYFGSRNIVWSPLWLTFINLQVGTQSRYVGSAQPNFSFYFFWVLLSVNVYFLFRTQKIEVKKV
jgi:hypothetical protein